MIAKVYTGARLDLEFYKGYPIINYEFEVFNDDDTDYNFSNSSGVFFKLLAKKNGSLLALLRFGLDSPTTNNIYLNDTGSSPSIIIQRTPRTAWYEVYSVEQGRNKLLFQGVAEL
jgi:hypothetical protein